MSQKASGSFRTGGHFKTEFRLNNLIQWLALPLT